MEWVGYIGKFPNFEAQVFLGDIGKEFALVIVKYKDILVAEAGFDADSNPYGPYETYEMASHQRKAGETRPTYRGIKKVIDKEMDLTCEEEDDLPFKKFAIVSTEAKNVFKFLYSAYVKEIYDYFKSHDNTLPIDSELIEEMSKYSTNNSSNRVVAHVLQVVKDIDPSKKVKIHATNTTKSKIMDKTQNYFKDVDENIPASALDILVSQFVSYLHVLAIETTCSLFPAKKAINCALLQTILHSLNIRLVKGRNDLPMEFILAMKNYIVANAAAKTPKKPGTAKKGPKKGTTTTKKGGRKTTAASKKTKEKKKEEEDIMDTIDNDDNWDDNSEPGEEEDD